MKKAIKLILCLTAFFLFTYASASTPQVVPALQEWKSTSGTLKLSPQGNIIIHPLSEKQLLDAATTLASDLKEMFGFEYKVTTGKMMRGAIFLSLGKEDQQLGKEGYKLDISSGVAIEAPTAKGVFWGTRTLLQMISNQPEGLQKGKALDFPLYESRGFMLDVGRKFFTMDFLKQYVKIMSFYKMNEFQVHLNDNGFVEFFGNDWNSTYSAFRLESESFPGLTAKDGSYTKQEFKEFQRMANRYGVEIIPEIDVPAHSLAFTHYNPRLAAEKKEYGMDHLDLYKKEVYEFVDTLFAEYLGGDDPVFVGPYVHIGTDEYSLKEVEQFRYFTDYYLKYVKKLGKEPRLWGGFKHMKGKTPVDVANVYVNAWNHGWMDVETALRDSSKVINTCDGLLYIVPAARYYYDFLNTKWLYENWTAEMMRKEDKIEKGNPNFKGAMFAVWNDHVGNGISQQDVHYRAYPALQLMGEKLWKGDNHTHVPYSDFEALCKRTPEAPGVNLLARVKESQQLTKANEVVQLNGKDTVLTKVAEIGYPYAVEFDIRTDSVPFVDAVLFKGPHSEFITNWTNTGKFAFRRDGYEFVFHDFRLPANQWVRVRVEGDHKGTTLFVDGKKIERLEGRHRETYNATKKNKSRIWYQETLIFPLQQIGDPFMGFKGKVRNVVCTQL
ncbi:MAG: family 20 glycosylhydrolase [Bacteroidales bacterium]